MGFFDLFISGFKRRCPLCAQEISEDDIETMKIVGKMEGIITCQDCWLAHNYSFHRFADLLDFYHGKSDEFVLHPHKPDSFVFRRGEKLQGDSEKTLDRMAKLAKNYFKIR